MYLWLSYSFYSLTILCLLQTRFLWQVVARNSSLKCDYESWISVCFERGIQVKIGFLLGHLQDNTAGLFYLFGGLLARSRLDYAALLFPAVLEGGQQQPVRWHEGLPGRPGKALPSRPKETPVSRGLRAGWGQGIRLDAASVQGWGLAPRQSRGWVQPCR